MILLMFILVFITTTDGCIRSKGVENAQTSSAVLRITCPQDVVKTADRSTTSATVSWSKTDFRLESSQPVQAVYQTVPIYGASAGVTKTFSEGSHRIEYKVVDEAGLIDSCTFSVTVSVIRCDRLFNRNPHVGRLTCDAGNVYGSACTLACYNGHTVIGSSTIECTQEGHWSGDIPFCQITTCPDPGTPIHGSRFCSTVNHAYGSLCTFTCNHGYQLVGGDKLFCESNNRDTYWSTDTPSCERIEQPRIEICPSDRVLTTSNAVTEIPKPRILFRTASGHEAPYTCSHFGENNKHNFTLGIHSVNCTAFDPKFGDKATVTCHFTIQIKANPCQTLTKPQNGKLLCSRVHGGGTASHDTSCKVHCDPGYTLSRDFRGLVAKFDCDSSGRWLPFARVPSCVQPKRPFEIRLPSEVLYTSSDCSDPLVLNSVKNKFQSAVLAAIRRPITGVCARNPGNCVVDELSTLCDDPHTFQSSETRFRRHTERTIRARHLASERSRSPRKRHLASDRWRGRSLRKRNTAQYRLHMFFHFGTEVKTSGDWPDEYHNAKRRLLGMLDTFEKQLMDGSFSISSKVTHIDVQENRDSLAYNTEIATCDTGYKFKRDIKLCVPCGAGTHYDLSAERCVECVRGQYQDREAQLLCVDCPPGTSTRTPGASSISQCVAIDECLSNPCLHHGVCQDGISAFTCHCQPGYAGPLCEQRVYDCSVHSCRHGGTCVPDGEYNYTCLCRTHYFGELCELHSVDGGWGEWSAWSPCSASCQGGETSRSRACDSPPPSESGETCQGPQLERKVCNLHDCPACKRLRRPYRGMLHCDHYDDYRECTISCPEGLDFSGPVFPVYTCGSNTSYLWPHETPDNPRCVLPACTKVSMAREVMYAYRSSLELACPSSPDVSDVLQAEVQRKAREVTWDLQCVRENTCSLQQPVVSCCSSQSRSRRQDSEDTGDWKWTVVDRRRCEVAGHHRVRRSSEVGELALGTTESKDESGTAVNDRQVLETTATYGEGGSVEIKVILVYHGQNNADDDSTFGMGYPDRLNRTTEELAVLTESLLNQSRAGDLFVKVDGRQIYTDPRTTLTVNSAVCPPGSMQSFIGLKCVECSPGSFYNTDRETCTLCEVGSYQPLPAQSTCHSCPVNQTTYGRGAMMRLECYNGDSSPPTISDEQYEQLELAVRDSALYHLLPIIMISSLVALTCLVIVVVIARHKRQVYHPAKYDTPPED